MNISYKNITFVALRADPRGFADAGVGFGVEFPVVVAVRKTLLGVRVHEGAVVALPAPLTDTLPLHTPAVVGASGVGAVN